MLGRLRDNGIRLTLEAEALISKESQQDQEKAVESILRGGKTFLNDDEIKAILETVKKPAITGVEVKRQSSYRPLAKEYSANVKVTHTRDVTGKSRTTGSIDDFIAYFRDRYTRMSRLLRTPSKEPYVDLADINRSVGERVKIIVAISGKMTTKKGNAFFEVEDLTGSFKAIVTQNDPKLFQKAKGIVNDDIVAFTGKVMEPFMIVEDILWPDIPITREQKRADVDLATVYLSDIHFGSKQFVERYFANFLKWINGGGPETELAGKVKYISIAGDVVDGIGIYPNQEKELAIKDIEKQYQMFDDFVEGLPDHIEVIVSPGNHDAVRRGEPMPAIGKDLIKSDVIRVGNPSVVLIEDLKHIIYHCTSMDSMIANVPGMSYTKPEKVMVEYLKRRHLSPIYGENPIIPEQVDYLVIEEPPDILHGGHVHKNGYASYRGTIVINSGTFQSQTEFQLKQGHVPTPGMVPVYEMKTGALRTLKFADEVQ